MYLLWVPCISDNSPRLNGLRSAQTKKGCIYYVYPQFQEIFFAKQKSNELFITRRKKSSIYKYRVTRSYYTILAAQSSLRKLGG